MSPRMEDFPRRERVILKLVRFIYSLFGKGEDFDREMVRMDAMSEDERHADLSRRLALVAARKGEKRP